METQTCSKCREVKPVEDFHKRSDRPRKRTVSWCNACIAAYDATWYAKYRDKICARVKAKRRQHRLEALEHYGHRCACCGETRYEFLDFDHKYNNGAAHRRQLLEERKANGGKGTGGWLIVEWMRKNNYPESMQILCKNCNGAKSMYGGCPHEAERQAALGLELAGDPFSAVVVN